MDPAQKPLVLHCLKLLSQFLCEKNRLQQYKQSFTKGDNANPRYQLNKYITDQQNWYDNEKIDLSSAIFEAIFHTTNAFKSTHFSSFFLENVVPEITKNTHPSDRIGSVLTNIKKLEAGLKAQPVMDNPSLFFSIAAIGAVVMSSAAYYMRNN